MVDDTDALPATTPPGWVGWPADVEGKGLSVARWGWPLRSLYSSGQRTVTAIPGGGRNVRSIAGDTWTVRFSKRPLRLIGLPIGVVWGGMIGNALLFAGLVGAVVLVPRVMVRALRTRRRRCVSCGYDKATLAEGSVCPECGTAGS